MKKILLTMAIAAVGLCSCQEQPKALKIDNALSQQEIDEGRLTPEVMWKMRRGGSSSLSPDGQTLLYTVSEYSMEENRGITTIWVKDLASGEENRLTDYTSNNFAPEWASDSQTIRFLSSRSGSVQVWQMNASGANCRQITSLDKDVEGFGFTAAGDKMWYVQRVHAADRASKDVYKDMPHSKARIYDDLMVRHWDYWEMGEFMHIFVAEVTAQGVMQGRDIIGEDAAWDAPLAPYFDMEEIAWSNKGDRLAYTCKPLTGVNYAVSTDSDIFIYDVKSQKTTNICKTEAQDAMPGYDKYPVWSPDDRHLAFRSQRRRGNESDKERLFVYDVETAQMADLTEDFDYNATNVRWADNEQIYFIAPIEATHQICRVPLINGEVEVITRGDHDINSFSMAQGKIVAEMCRISMATEFFDLNLETKELTQITAFNKGIYDHITMGKVEKRWVKTTDGKQMLTWVILPPDFDASKKYPVLLYCQGGPQSVVSQFWSYRWNFQLMAAQGYVVVAPNRRGLPSFGQEWLDQISGDYSGQNIQDYLSAIDDVAKEEWADETRMGCVGASYGGYSVYYLAGHHQKRFKAFIAHCGIFDFDSMYGSTEELWFVNNDYGGSYWDKHNPTAMRSYANSPHKAVDQWDTPILIVTGEYDYRIPYTQSLEAFTAAKLRGIPARLVSFEDEAHQVFKPQNSLVWNREFFGWLDQYLK